MSLQSLLQDPHVNVPQLFQQPDILNQLKYKISKFVAFCKKNEQFTNIMITLGIKTPMHRHQNIQMRKIAHVASDFLTCDNDTIAQLFIIQELQPRIRCYSEDDDQVLEEIVTNQATGQQLIVQRSPSSKQGKTYTQFQRKYLHLIDLLSYISQPSPDQNCLNYLSKLLNTVVRVKPQQIFAFFQQKPQIMKRMIELINYPSISYSIAKIINQSEDKKYRDFKIGVVSMAIKQILAKIGTGDGFGVGVEFVQEVFQKNRHRGDQLDQIKIATQCLVQKTVINTILSGVFSFQSPTKTSNCLLYLLKVAERMNIDQEQDPYSYTEPQSNKPTMDFQVDQLFQSFQKLVSLASSFTRQKYLPQQIFVFYDLLLAMSRNSRFKEIRVDAEKCIFQLIKVLNSNQKSKNGIIKNKIVMLIQNIHNSYPQSSPQPIVQQCPKPSMLSLQILNQIERIDQLNPQSICYKQKLKLLFTTSFDNVLNEVHWKYSNTLAPSNYTENRNFKVKELEFVKNYTRNKDKMTKQKDNGEASLLNKQSQIDILDQDNHDDDAKNQETSVLSTRNTSGYNGIGINLDLLNKKIGYIKAKKGNQLQQLPPIIPTQSQQSPPNTSTQTQQQPPTEQTKHSSTEKSNLDLKQNQVQVSESKRQQEKGNKNQIINVGFYIRYLMLY